jgi:hypothetical protein
MFNSVEIDTGRISMLRSSVLVAATAAVLAGCLDPDPAPDPTTGQVDLALVGQAPDGTAYRLRNASITVTGPGNVVTFDTEDDPDRTAITQRLATGTYSLALGGSWRLERLDPGGPTPITASLLSTNPQGFFVLRDEVTRLALRFRVAGGEVELGEGDIRIGVEVVVGDDPHVQAVVAAPATLGILEGGVGVVEVRLAAAPATDVVVTATPDDPAALAVAPASVTFTTATWNEPRYLQVAARPDDDVGDGSTALRLTAADAAPATVGITSLDDDVLAPVVPSLPIAVDEGTSASVGVHLDHRPVAATTVAITSSHPSVLAVSPATLTFTPDDWQIAQPVTLTAVEDLDYDDTPVTITVTAAGGSQSFDVLASDTSEVVLGWPDVPPEVTEMPTGQLTFHRVTLAEPVNLVRFAVAARGSGEVRIGLYTHSSLADRPNTLLYASDPVALPPLLAVVEVPAIAQAATTLVGPGTYWLAITGTAAFDVATAASGAPPVQRCRQSTSASTLPAFVSPFPVPTCSQERAIGIAAFGRP